MERWRGPDFGFRPVFFPALAFVAGGAVGPETGLEGETFLLLTGICWMAVGWWRRAAGGHLLLLLAFLGCGASLSTLAMRTLVPAGIEGGPVVLQGVIERYEPGEAFTRLDLLVVRAGAPLTRARFRVRLSANEPLGGLEVGQWVRLRARLKSQPEVGNPGEWDGRRWRERRGLLFGGSVIAQSVLPLSAPAPWRQWVRRQHTLLASEVRGLAPNEEAAALYLTLAAGLRASLGAELEEAFGNSGLAHILSVSGLHVAALAVLLLALLRWCVVRVAWRSVSFDPRRLAAPLAVPLIWAYVAFTGWQVPAVRSAVMASVVFLGFALWRRADSLNALAAAAVLIVAVDPASVMDLSLQLSFVAVFSLIVLSPALRRLIPFERPTLASPRWRRWTEAAVQTICASAAVTLASLPLLAGSFGRVSTVGMLANIVCLPLSAVLTVLAAGGAALFVIAPIASVPFLFLGGWGSELLVRAARAFAAAPVATVDVQPMGAALGSVFLLGLLCFAIGERRRRMAALAAPLALLWPSFLGSLSPRPGLVVTFLAVGQGDAIVLSSAGRHMIMDGGGTPHGADTGQRFVLPFLRHERIRAFELAALSHPHPDHALGLISTLRKIPTERLWIAAGTGGGALTRQLVEAARSREGRPIPAEEVEDGEPSVRLGEASIEVLGPPRDRLLLEGVNDRSIVLRVRHGSVTFLLTGDIESAAEEALDERLSDDPSPVTVLKAPHHGSRTSSTEGFVQRVRPRHVIFCVGRNNRFGFPHDEVVDRYVTAGAKCHRTDTSGALRVESDGRDVRLVPFRPPEAEEVPRTVARRISRRHLRSR